MWLKAHSGMSASIKKKESLLCGQVDSHFEQQQMWWPAIARNVSGGGGCKNAIDSYCEQQGVTQ